MDLHCVQKVFKNPGIGVRVPCALAQDGVAAKAVPSAWSGVGGSSCPGDRLIFFSDFPSSLNFDLQPGLYPLPPHSAATHGPGATWPEWGGGGEGNERIHVMQLKIENWF